MSDDALQDLVGRIASASLQPDPWSDLLSDVSTFAGACGALVIPLYGAPAGMRATKSIEPLLDTYVNDGWFINDFRYRGVARMLKRGITVDQDFIDADTMKTLPYYEAFLRPLGLRYFAGLALTSGETTWALTLQRNVGDDPYGPEEQERLLRLIEPLQRVMTLSGILAAAQAAGAVDVLSLQSAACLLLDQFGRVRYLNAAAERLIGHTIDVGRGRLTLPTRAQTQELHRRIQKALGDRSSSGEAEAAPMLIGEEKPSFTARVTRLGGVEDSIFRKYFVLIQIVPINHRIGIDERLVADAFKLTRRELDVLQALLRTTNLVAAAESVGLSHETARSHLKAVFGKTETTSQAELISLMAGFATAASLRF